MVRIAAARVDYDSLSVKVAQALRTEFPLDTIELGKGYLGRVHVKIVSSKFNGMDEERKQAYVWDILKEHLKEDAQGVSMVVPYATEEL